ncbi:redox-regulated ATPase YchF [Candidatus Microgenomates bacterium]|nr:redox-regulated ATPase YchF [Candidatus Microgenomates bacterium]
MSLRVGIVGLPNVGKSTLFNALLKKRVALSANYPFATVEPNVGVVAVPDERLEKLAELVQKEEKMESPPPVVPAIVEFVDIAGLVKGAHKGEGLGNQFLSHIREVDAIIHVLRDFEDQIVARAGSENPDADKLTVETELALADLETVEKLCTYQEKETRVSKDPLESQKLAILKQIKDELENGRGLGQYNIGDERLRSWFLHLPLLSIKPILYVYNVSEQDYKSQLYDRGSYKNEMVISARLEEELIDLSDQERIDYLKELGIEETGLERLIKKAYQLLGLTSFLTAGPKEVRAWTIKSGTRAPQAAGVIHTDFEKNFIRAQVIEYEKLIEAGSYAQAKSKGWIRTEGKDYVIQDGDVIEFLVSS